MTELCRAGTGCNVWGHVGEGLDIVQRSNVAGLSAVPPGRVPPLPPRPATAGRLGAPVWGHGRRLAMRAAMGAAVVLLAVAAALGVMRSVYADRIYPGVYVESVNVGGSDLSGARALLQQRAETLEHGTIAFSYGGKTWTPALSDVGITIDIDQSLARAYDVGREANARDRLFAMEGLLRHDRHFPLVIRFDQNVLNSWLDGVDAELGLPPHDASLTIDGTKVTIVPEVEGTITDRAQIQQLVYGAAHSLQPTGGPLPVIAKVAQVRAADLEPVKARVEQMLAKPVELSFQKKTWELDPAALSAFLTQTTDPTRHGAEALTIGVDETALAKWLSEQIEADVDRDPANAKIAWDDDKGAVVATKASKDGYKLKPRTLARDVATSLMGDHAPIEVPVTVLHPDVDSNNLGALGITTKIAVGDSDYEGSDSGRATNIEVGSRLLNGTLVPPHGEFSFNHAIGVIDKDKGFVTAPIIDGKKIGEDDGGGICQVSTTVFRAAMRSGLPITEWWPHTFRLGFYEQDGWAPGFDASILQPEGDPFSGGDFKFENTTDSWMLVESYTENDRVYVILYGPDLGYTVTFTDPVLSDPTPPPPDEEIVDKTLSAGTVEQTGYAQEGISVDYQRIVTDKDGNVVRQDDWPTTFSPRPNIWKVSPDMKGQSPAQEGNSTDGG
jgi:vancomycin resistance protein YoaR